MVPGVTTSGNMIRQDNMDRVTIPKLLSLADCCTAYDQNMSNFIRYKLPTYSTYTLNHPITTKVIELGELGEVP